MPKSKTQPKPRATVSKERRLALSLCAILDAFSGTETATTPDQMESLEAGHSLLAELGYGDLESIPRRVATLTSLLQDAMAAGNGKEIARLGEELDRAQKGLAPSKVKAEKKADDAK